MTFEGNYKIMVQNDDGLYNVWCNKEKVRLWWLGFCYIFFVVKDYIHTFKSIIFTRKNSIK